jgi:hypothetical protein
VKFPKWVMAALVLVFVAAGAAAQESAESAARRRAEKALAEELVRLRAAVLETIRQEMGVAPAATATGLALITEDLLKKHATYLASDELEGRQAGYEGNVKAAEYIAGVMKESGLAPVGDLGTDGKPTYFQEFQLGKLSTRNVLGFLEGSDAELKKDILVLGAHFDHLGTGDNPGPPMQRSGRAREGDKIWNGADDNGSGTSTLLAVIKALGTGGAKPKRSILFLAFSGEEGGLIGSRFYVNHPIAPIGRHIFMLNLDMVGRNSDAPIKIEGVGSASGTLLRKTVESAVADTGLRAVVNDEVTVSGGDSDHTPFRMKGVPFTFFFSGLHADYHKVTDHAEKLAYDNMVRVGRTAAQVLLALANSPETLASRKLEFGKSAPVVKKRTLGLELEDLAEGERGKLGLEGTDSGLLVKVVRAGSVAAAAGLRIDDVLVGVNGKPLAEGKEVETLRTVLDGVKPGTDVPIDVIRDGARRTLQGRWTE